MTLPNHPDKHDEAALVTAGETARQITGNDPAEREAPEAVVLTYTDVLGDHVRESYAVETIDWLPMGDLLTVGETDGRVGVAGEFGVGGPGTALVVESMVAAGVERFLIVGYAGGIGREVAPEEPVVASEAIRDEGTSHHYLPSSERIAPPGDVADDLREHLERAGEPVRHGPTWTTDAAFRETPGEVRRYREEGVLTVEMEAATLFAVARHRGAEAGAAFAISDYLTPESWESNHEVVDRHLARLLDRGIDALADRDPDGR